MLEKTLIQRVLNEALKTGGDFAELFEETYYSTAYTALNGTIEGANSGIRSGIGLRIYHELESFYAYTNDTSEENLMKTADTLASALHGERIKEAKKLEEVVYENQHPIKIYPSKTKAEAKIKLMKEVCESALAYDEVISKVIVNYIDNEQHVTISNSDGRYIKDVRVRTRMSCNAIAQDGDLVENGTCTPGGHMGMEFYEIHTPKAIGEEAARIAKTMLYADDCPSGVMPVIIDNGFGGVIFHEACGHSLEATSVAKNHSVFSGKLGTQIAHSCVSAVDDGTITNAWGSANIDDEGNFTKRNLLIENGILKSYLVDTLNGRRMHTPSTSSSRRESYQYEPTSRMTNTFILPGNHELEDMIQSISYGLYAKKMGGGSVDPSTGDFNFAVNEGYLIQDGKIVKPVKGATLIGNGADTLMKIDMVGKDLATAQGMCGSSSGSIPTDVGQPPIRVSSMIVGGKDGGDVNE